MHKRLVVVLGFLVDFNFSELQLLLDLVDSHDFLLVKTKQLLALSLKEHLMR